MGTRRLDFCATRGHPERDRKTQDKRSWGVSRIDSGRPRRRNDETHRLVHAPVGRRDPFGHDLEVAPGGRVGRGRHVPPRASRRCPVRGARGDEADRFHFALCAGNGSAPRAGCRPAWSCRMSSSCRALPQTVLANGGMRPTMPRTSGSRRWPDHAPGQPAGEQDHADVASAPARPSPTAAPASARAQSSASPLSQWVHQRGARLSDSSTNTNFTNHPGQPDRQQG